MRNFKVSDKFEIKNSKFPEGVTVVTTEDYEQCGSWEVNIRDVEKWARTFCQKEVLLDGKVYKVLGAEVMHRFPGIPGSLAFAVEEV